jgi:hypothetical protein
MKILDLQFHPYLIRPGDLPAALFDIHTAYWLAIKNYTIPLFSERH